MPKEADSMIEGPSEDVNLTILVEEYKMMHAEVLFRESQQTQIFSVGTSILVAHAAVASQIVTTVPLRSTYFYIAASACFFSSLFGLFCLRVDTDQSSIAGYEAKLISPRWKHTDFGARCADGTSTRTLVTSRLSSSVS